MSTITAHFTLTGEDYERYLRYFYAHTAAGRRQMRRLYAVGVALFLLFVGLEYDHPRFGIAQPAYFVAYMISSAALLGGGYWFIITRLWPTLAQAALRISPQKGMFTETTVEIDDDGMAVRTDQGVGRLDWERVLEIADTEEALYLFMGGINAFILPKRGFARDEDGEETLRRVLKVIAPEGEGQGGK